MQRVAAIRGDLPAIVVVPHGYDGDDKNTSIIGEQIIKELGCYGVINYGWQRADQYDYYKDKANCNSIDHLQNDVVKQEFFEPLNRFATAIYSDGYIPNIFIIHGFGKNLNKISKSDIPVEVVLGIGNGKNPSWSCDAWVALCFANLLDKQGYGVYFGKPEGSYSGRNPDNLNQLFVPSSTSSMSDAAKVQSIQIEICKEFRETEDQSKMTGADLAMCIEDTLERQKDWKKWAKHPYDANFPSV